MSINKNEVAVLESESVPNVDRIKPQSLHLLVRTERWIYMPTRVLMGYVLAAAQGATEYLHRHVVYAEKAGIYAETYLFLHKDDVLAVVEEDKNA